MPDKEKKEKEEKKIIKKKKSDVKVLVDKIEKTQKEKDLKITKLKPSIKLNKNIVFSNLKLITGKSGKKRSDAFCKIYIDEKNNSSGFKLYINEIDYDSYFKTNAEIFNVKSSVLKFIELNPIFLNIYVKVSGGGITSQSEAVKYAIAKTLSSFSEETKLQFRSVGLLTRDSRICEPKRSGFKKSRKKEQFSKR